MAVKFTNNAKTTLASGITSTATSATVVDGSVFPTLGAGEYFYCTFDDTTNNEIVKVTARSGNTLTIVRGVDNTTARAFSSGDAAELRATAGLLTDIQENIAAKSANQTVYNTTTASSATSYDIGIDPSVEANAMVFLNGVMQHHDTFSFSGSTLTFDTAPADGMALEVIVDNLINLQSSNLTVDTFTAADVGGNPQTDFTLSDSPAAETNLIVFVDGVFQDQDAYTISSNVLTMTDGVVADRVVTVYVINPVNIGTPSDGTVTSAKLSGNITMPANLTVTGDVAFDSPTFVVDNANSRVGIGTASPSTLLDIVGDVKMSANLTVDTDTLVVSASGDNVGIGTSTIFGTTQISNTAWSSGAPYGTVLTVTGNNTNDANWGHLLISDSTTTTGNGGMIRFATGSTTSDMNPFAGIDGFTEGSAYGGLKFLTRPSGGTATARMTIDSSGHVMVNTDNTLPADNNVEGISLTTYNGGLIQASRTSQPALTVNRISTDGDVVLIKKAGTTVGSIGIQYRAAPGDSLYFVASDTGIIASPGEDAIVPATTNGATRDAAIDLGVSSGRFKDLYLSGGIHLGGTTSANELHDYEESTWTPQPHRYTGGLISATYTSSGSYTKIGRLVFVEGQIEITAITSQGSSYTIIGGLPFDAVGGAYTTHGQFQGINLNTTTVITRAMPSSNGMFISYDVNTNFPPVAVDWTTGLCRFSATYITYT